MTDLEKAQETMPNTDQQTATEEEQAKPKEKQRILPSPVFMALQLISGVAGLFFGLLAEDGAAVKTSLITVGSIQMFRFFRSLRYRKKYGHRK